MLAHNQSTEEVLKSLSVNAEAGLSKEEVTQRLTQYGPNRLREKKKKTNFQRFVDQFKDAMILILLAAAVVSFTMICVEQNWGELFEPALILLIVVEGIIL